MLRSIQSPKFKFNAGAIKKRIPFGLSSPAQTEPKESVQLSTSQPGKVPSKALVDSLLAVVSAVGATVDYAGQIACLCLHNATGGTESFPFSQGLDTLVSQSQRRHGFKRMALDRTADAKSSFDPADEASLPKADLDGPLMIVPGWRSSRRQFDALAAKLAGDKDEFLYVQDGKFFRSCDPKGEPIPESEINSDTKVFVVQNSHTGDSPERSAPMLSNSVKAVERVSGRNKPSVLAYSQGGLATRAYLDSGGELGKVMFLASPQKGAPLANVTERVVDAAQRSAAVDWMLDQAGIVRGDTDSVQWLLADGPKVNKLNSRWSEQKTRTEAVKFVGGEGKLTFALPSQGLIRSGDGVVPRTNLAPDGESLFTVRGAKNDHQAIVYNPDVYREVVSFFGQ